MPHHKEWSGPKCHSITLERSCQKPRILRSCEQGGLWFWLTACVTLEMSLFQLVKGDTRTNWYSGDFPAQGLRSHQSSVLAVAWHKGCLCRNDIDQQWSLQEWQHAPGDVAKQGYCLSSGRAQKPVSRLELSLQTTDYIWSWFYFILFF